MLYKNTHLISACALNYSILILLKTTVPPNLGAKNTEMPLKPKSKHLMKPSNLSTAHFLSGNKCSGASSGFVCQGAGYSLKW